MFFGDSPALFRLMSRSLLLSGLVLLLVTTPERAAGQRARAQEELRQGIEAAARGDTLVALALLDRAISLHPQLAEAHFQRAQILASRASGKATDYEDRIRAQAALEEALRYDPGNPMYLLELGKLMLKQQIRVDAQRVLQRALEAATRADAATLAEVHFQLGILRETQWQRFRYRYSLPFNVAQVDADRAFFDARYVWRLLDNSAFPGRDQGAAEREAMLGHFRSALTHNPSHVGAASHLLAYLFDEGQMEEYTAVARQFVRAASARPEAYLALGLGLHRSAKTDEAGGAFQYALSLMPEPERRQFEDVVRILSKDAEKEYEQLSDTQKAEYERRFWSHADPLFLTPANEFWLEYMARMAYADIRFGLPEYRIRGWETDPGLILVRYGEPLRKATFAPQMSDAGDFEAVGRITTVWSYGYQGPVFIFRQNPGYRRASFAGDFRFYADDYRTLQPVSLTAPSLPERHPLPVQAVRFRGDRGDMDLEVHALVPLSKLGATAPVASGEVESGLFVQTERAVELVRRTRSDVVEFKKVGEKLESWRIPLKPDAPYLVGVEAREPLTWHAAVGRVAVAPKRFAAGELSLSDLLLGNTVEPRVKEPQARADFRIVPNPAMSYAPGQPIALYFEVYNLVPDSSHFASYEIELVVTVEEIERGGKPLSKILGELADKWGLTPEGSSAAQLRFTKSARVLARDLIPEYLKIQVPDAPPGRYGLRLTLRDQNADRRAVAEREFHIRRRE